MALNGLENIEGLTEEQIQSINGLADGLTGKNEELLSKLSKAKEHSSESASEVEKLRQFKQAAEAKAAEDAQNYEEAKRLWEERHNQEVDKYKEQAQSTTAQLEKLLITDGLSRALDSVSINPALKGGAEAILREGITITEGKAVAGEKSLSEYVREWSESESGKAFCLAPANNGGNASGSSRSVEKPAEGKDAVRAGLRGRLQSRGMTN